MTSTCSIAVWRLAHLRDIIHHEDDHLVIIDIGVADDVEPKAVSLGKLSFTPG